MKRFFPLLLILCASCQKEPDFLSPENLQQKTTGGCKLNRSFDYDLNGSVVDSTTYIYQNDRVTKLIGTIASDSFTVVYSNNAIVRRNYFESGVLEGYDIYSYNSNGSVRLIEGFRNAFPSGGSLEKSDSTVYVYTNGKLTGRSRYVAFMSGTPFELVTEDSFSYNGKNIVAIVHSDYFMGTTTRSLAIEYDNQPSLFRQQNYPHLLLHPLFFEDQEHYFAFAFSENNVTRVMSSNPGSVPAIFSYEKDQKGNLTQVKKNGDVLWAFQYKCP